MRIEETATRVLGALPPFLSRETRAGKGIGESRAGAIHGLAFSPCKGIAPKSREEIIRKRTQPLPYRLYLSLRTNGRSKPLPYRYERTHRTKG